jgi:hypothetical protein
MRVTNPSPRKLSPRDIRRRAGDCDTLIVAAGFEKRALKVIESMASVLPRRLVLVRYSQRFRENEETFGKMAALASDSAGGVDCAELELDPRFPDAYLGRLRKTLARWRPDAQGEIWVDISAFTMQGICATLAGVREMLGSTAVRTLYTEAETYLPSREDVENKGARNRAMSLEMSGNLIPKQFSGVSSAVSTCLLVFAGYEKHRSIGVVDELNPAKLVLIFGRPPRADLQWRLEWSRKLHEPIRGIRPTASEVVSTLDPRESLRLLSEYYGFLFNDHNIAIAPICSKMQCVATYLFWERYRDVQLVFPLPVTYLPRRFSIGCGATFEWPIPAPSMMGALTSSLLSTD